MGQRKNLDLLIRYLETCCGGQEQLNASGKLPLSAWKIEEVIWPLNELFRDVKNIKNVPYEVTNESYADNAIEHFISTGAWGPMSVGVKRVMYERHMQTLLSLQLKKPQTSAVITVVPDILPSQHLLGAILLIMYHSVKLQYPIEN